MGGEAKRTAGPWRADDNGDGTHCITAGRGADVADTRSASNEPANAKFIVRACNSYDDMLAALETEVAVYAGMDADKFAPATAARIKAMRRAVMKAKGELTDAGQQYAGPSAATLAKECGAAAAGILKQE